MVAMSVSRSAEKRGENGGIPSQVRTHGHTESLEGRNLVDRTRKHCCCGRPLFWTVIREESGAGERRARPSRRSRCVSTFLRQRCSFE